LNRTRRKTKFFRRRKARPKTAKTRSSRTLTIFTAQFVKSRGFLVMLVLFIFILIMAFFFGEGGILEIIKARGRIEQLKQEIANLEKEKEMLIKEIGELKKNPMALEKKAREKLWLMKKNEKVVVIVKDKENEKNKNEQEREKGKNKKSPGH
jgi:cell division protein FtsB